MAIHDEFVKCFYALSKGGSDAERNSVGDDAEYATVCHVHKQRGGAASSRNAGKWEVSDMTETDVTISQLGSLPKSEH